MLVDRRCPLRRRCRQFARLAPFAVFQGHVNVGRVPIRPAMLAEVKEGHLIPLRAWNLFPDVAEPLPADGVSSAAVSRANLAAVAYSRRNRVSGQNRGGKEEKSKNQRPELRPRTLGIDRLARFGAMVLTALPAPVISDVIAHAVLRAKGGRLTAAWCRCRRERVGQGFLASAFIAGDGGGTG